MFWQLLLISVATWIFYYRWQRRRLYKIAKAIPSGVQSYPVVGHAYLLSGNDEDRMRGLQIFGRKAIENGGLSTLWMMNTLYVNVADPRAAETIAKACVQKDENTVKFIRTVIGNGSIFARVHIWRPRRKILAPIFSLKNMHQFVPVFNKQSVIMTKLLAPMAETGDFSIWKYITTYTFDAVCETTLDIQMNAQSKPHVPFLTAFDSLLGLVAQRCSTPWLYPDFVYKNLAYYKQFVEARQLVWDFMDEVVQRKRREQKTREQEGKEASGMRTFLDMMIERSGKGDKGYTDLELREEAMVIIFAGTDTSAVGAAFTTVMLSRYPEVQEKVYQELQDVFGNSERPVTAEDLPNLKYLEVVIKECLRLYTPVPIITKEIEEDVQLRLNYAMNSMKTVIANLCRRYKILPPQNMDPMKLKEPLPLKYSIMMKHVDDYVVRPRSFNSCVVIAYHDPTSRT
ncbi:hypothetical protein MSG28_007448 [Choristoneura fumiferana]|uniref:Uncharacterized protein n=1 Tax=Choristoneura fumiferana TaxID=7141 RepID=A0ACC0JXF8_CHOFU|nr:hypothetical protein MSG28_007448 [Choristoneura fumiferana]